MKKLVSLLLVLILLLAIPCATLAAQPSKADISRMRISSVRATCVNAAAHPDVVVRHDSMRIVFKTDKYGKPTNVVSYLSISQSAGFVSYALKRAGISSGAKTYKELTDMTTRIFIPRNGALVFNGSIVGFYFGGKVYYSTFQKFICTPYRAKTWSVGWIKGL